VSLFCLLEDVISSLKNKPSGLAATEETPVFTPIIIDGEIADIKIAGLVNFTEEEKKFLVMAMKLELQVLASAEFKKRALTRGVRETNGRTLQGVYEHVISGADNRTLKADKILDVYLIMYYQKGRVLGYNYMNLKQWVNRYFYAQWMKGPHGLAILAGHLFHEYLHLAGYKHRWSHKGTLVYEWGYMVRDIGIDILNGRGVEKTLRLV